MSPYDYFLFVCATLYLVVLVWYCCRKRSLIPCKWTGIALLSWPFLLIPQYLSSLGLGDYVVAASSMMCWLPVMIMTAIYLAVRELVIDGAFPPPRLFLLPAMLALVSQIPVIAMALADGLFLAEVPAGEFLQYWYLYQAYLVAGLCWLALGIMTTEDIQRYHHYLGDQVVDAAQYRLSTLAGVLATSVTVAIVCILAVSVAAFDVIALVWWQTFYHLVSALMLLMVLIILAMPLQSSPSVLDYARLEQRQAERKLLNNTFIKAQQAVIDHKAYKKVGLRIADVARLAGVDPTDLAIATRVLKNCSFRGWIYHYRLEYAKNVLLRSDAKLANVARRLGLNSKKFLSEVLVKYLSRPGS